MSPLIRLELVIAAIGFVLAVAALLTAAGMKRWVRLPVGVRTAVPWHRYTALGSLATCVVLTYTCLKFHFPVADPLAALDSGWFAIHPLNGLAAIFLYPAKILVVRRSKSGWKAPGLVLGCALFTFWLVQIATVMPAFRAWIKGG
jgi:hypothetical protein